MELRNLNTFLKVAELENITRASAELGYAQSTVTTHIQQLEQEIGRPLFDRVGKRVMLTAAGQELISIADRMLQLSQEALSLGREGKEIAGDLRLGTVESLGIWEICDLLPEYHARYPRVNVQIDVATGVKLVEQLRRNELDIIFFLDRGRREPDFVRPLSLPFNLVFVARADDPLCAGPISLEQVAASPMVLAEANGIYHEALEEVLLSRGLDFQPVVEVNNTDMIVRLIRKGMGISFLPECAVRESVEKGHLAVLDVEDFDIKFYGQLFYHKNKWLTPQMDGFIRLVQEYYGKQEQTGLNGK